MSDSELERYGEEANKWLARIQEEREICGDSSDEAHALEEAFIRHTFDDFTHQDTYDEN